MEYCFVDENLIGYGLCDKIVASEKHVIFQFKTNKLNIESLRINVAKQLDVYNNISFREILDYVIGDISN